MDSVKQTVKYIEAGLKTLNMQSTIEVEQESDTEFLVNMPDIGVSVLIETDGNVLQSFPRSASLRGPKWQVFTTTQLPATFEQPEDVDEEHRGDFTTVAEAVSRIFEIVVRDRILDMIEFLGMAEDNDQRLIDESLAADHGYCGLVRIK